MPVSALVIVKMQRISVFACHLVRHRYRELFDRLRNELLLEMSGNRHKYIVLTLDEQKEGVVEENEAMSEFFANLHKEPICDRLLIT